MADFEQKMQLLAERGTPVGPEELIERVEQELAGHSVVVVGRQRKGRTMTKTDELVTTTTPPSRPGVAWAVAAFVAVIAVAGLLYLIASGGDTEPPATDPPPTTAAPEGAGAQDVAIFEEAVTAWYGNDFETVNRLLAIPGRSGDQAGWTADDVRRQMEYDSAIGARADRLTCVVPPQPSYSEYSFV